VSGQALRIGQAAALAGVSTRTLRYYEELGLLRPSAHSPGGARRYSDDDVARLARIRELKDLLGFNLDEVRVVLGAEDQLGSLKAAYLAQADQEAQRAIIEQALAINARLQAAVGAKLERLTEFHAALVAKEARYRGILDGSIEPATPAARR
jgi:DNA-binding transcriptional MerR regulator